MEHNGDIVDCVDIYEQPSIRKMREQGIDIKEISSLSKETLNIINSTEEEKDPVYPDLTALENRLKEPCVEGTVPIRRVTFDEIAEYGSLQNYLHRAPPAIDTHENAMLTLWDDSWGAEAQINRWNPYVESSGDFSLAQIWVVGGEGDDWESVEAGWIAKKNSSSKIFIYFTNDAYDSGCWNDDCGFVHTNTSICLDCNATPYSVIGGNQYVSRFHLVKPGTNGHWYFTLNGGVVGYWPYWLFDDSGLRYKADHMAWGGEIYDLSGSSHTATDMGSGRWPSEGFKYAAYQRTLRYNYDSALHWTEANPNVPSDWDHDCYGLSKYYSSGSWKNYFYYGGPGLNPSCP